MAIAVGIWDLMESENGGPYERRSQMTFCTAAAQRVTLSRIELECGQSLSSTPDIPRVLLIEGSVVNSNSQVLVTRVNRS